MQLGAVPVLQHADLALRVNDSQRSAVMMAVVVLGHNSHIAGPQALRIHPVRRCAGAGCIR